MSFRKLPEPERRPTGTLIISWMTDKKKFDSVQFQRVEAVSIIKKKGKIKVVYREQRIGRNEVMVFKDDKFPGLSIRHGQREIFHRHPDEMR